MNAQVDDEYFGYIGKLLKIDLNDNSISIEPINKSFANLFMGGAGYACRYLYDLIDEHTDPLSPENRLMIMTGPFCLTSAPSFGRFVICSKSPYTNFWGESNCGGFIGPELKKAGFDGIIITGKAKIPSFIKIVNEDVEILEISSFWGKGIKETEKRLKDITGQPKARVLSIGPAGEKLIKYAIINADGRSAGRTGMGAVMGSKNLKAILIRGNKSKPKIANESEFRETSKKTLKFILDSLVTKALRGFGTSAGVMTAHSNGDLPIKYWSQGEWDQVFKISGERLKKDHLIKNKSCYGCPIGCGRIIKIEGKKSIYADCEGPEYETIAGFGSMILNDNLESIAIANNLCNNWGLDTISTSGTIAFLYDLYNKKKITQQDTDGLELEWGNSEAMLQLIKKIAFRDGIGDLLAEGSAAVGRHFHINENDIAIVNNLEVPYHDIRASYGLALTYAFAPRGACHTSGDVFKVMKKGNEIDFSSLGIKKIDMFSNNKKMAKYSALVHDYRALYSSLISCFFSNPPPTFMAELIKNLLGKDFTVDDIITMGERIFNMKRLFNIKMGLSADNDKIPQILLTPTKEGAVKGLFPDFEKIKSYYYEIREWDPITGKPISKKLEDLGLSNLQIR